MLSYIMNFNVGDSKRVSILGISILSVLILGGAGFAFEDAHALQTDLYVVDFEFPFHTAGTDVTLDFFPDPREGPSNTTFDSPTVEIGSLIPGSQVLLFDSTDGSGDQVHFNISALGATDDISIKNIINLDATGSPVGANIFSLNIDTPVGFDNLSVRFTEDGDLEKIVQPLEASVTNIGNHFTPGTTFEFEVVITSTGFKIFIDTVEKYSQNVVLGEITNFRYTTQVNLTPDPVLVEIDDVLIDADIFPHVTLITDPASCDNAGSGVWTTPPDTCTLPPVATIALRNTWIVDMNTILVIGGLLSISGGESFVNNGTIEVGGTVNSGGILDNNGPLEISGTYNNDNTINNLDTINIDGSLNNLNAFGSLIDNDSVININF